MPIKIALIAEPEFANADWFKRLTSEIAAAKDLAIVRLVFSKPDSTKINWSKRLARAWWQIERRAVLRSRGPNETVSPNDLGSAETSDEDKTPVPSPAQADLVIDLTRTPGATISATETRFGVWYVDVLKSAPYAFAVDCLIHKRSGAEINLFRVAPNENEHQALGQAFVDLRPTALMLDQAILEKSASLMLRELKRTAMTERCETERGNPSAAYDHPSASQMAFYLFRLFQTAISRSIEKVLGKLQLRPGAFELRFGQASALSFDLFKLTSIKNPKGHYFADPFLFRQDEETYVFFEDYQYQKRKGRISVGKLVDETLTDVRSVIETDYHMSFPFVFSKGGKIYMIPETGASKQIELWECSSFPDRWFKSKNIMKDIIAADSVIFEHNGTDWLFTSTSSDSTGDLNSELHLFKFSGDDLDTVEAHPLNPVIIDSRRARNGGRILSIDGENYRVSQNKSFGIYGAGLNLMKIDALTMTEYRESVSRTVLPAGANNAIGCHHLDVLEDVLITDVRLKYDP